MYQSLIQAKTLNAAGCKLAPVTYSDEQREASKSAFLALGEPVVAPGSKLVAPLRWNAPSKVPGSLPVLPTSRPKNPSMFGVQTYTEKPNTGPGLIKTGLSDAFLQTQKF